MTLPQFLSSRFRFMDFRRFGWMFSGLFLLAVLSGCKKDSGGEEEEEETEFYVKFKANGVQKEFKSMALAQVFPLNDQELYGAMAQGYLDFNSSNKTHVGIFVWSESPITTTTYRNSEYVQNADGNDVAQLVLSYPDDDGNGHISMSPVSVTTPPFDKIVSDAVLKITTLTETRMAGEFSGTLFLPTDATYTNTVKITEGKFNVQRY